MVSVGAEARNQHVSDRKASLVGEATLSGRAISHGINQPWSKQWKYN